MIEEYLSLIRLTKEHISQHFASNSLIETVLKLKPNIIPKKEPPSSPPQPKHTYIPSPKTTRVTAEPTPLNPPPREPKLSPQINEARRDILPKLKELFPEIRWIEPPLKMIDLIFIGSEMEAELYAKISDALSKRDIQCRICPIEAFESSLCEEGAKAIVLTRQTLLAHETLKKHARRDEALRPHLGSTPILIAPPLSDLASPEQKKHFWNHLLQTVTA